MKIEKRERIESFDYPSFRLEITLTPDGRVKRIVGWLKSRRTNLPTDIELFYSEDQLAELLDDFGEAFDEVRKWGDKVRGVEE